ncbi:MAG: AAA family ATPase [Eubacteriales bacterium]|nr:AAA family ATPase [Eubacteriales bacterium]
MFIENFIERGLGIFQKVKIEFSKDKINIIKGKNGCGKTTILAV